MVCLTSCAIAFVFLVAMVYMNLALRLENRKYLTDFMGSLDPKLQEQYRQIVAERQMLYFTGFGVGLLLSLLATFYMKMKPTARVCMVMAGTFLFTYFFYILSPKSDHIVRHLDSQEQREKWLVVYKDMQMKYHTGLVLGIIGAGLLGKGIC
jgi:uncharacterized protein YacL